MPMPNPSASTARDGPQPRMPSDVREAMLPQSPFSATSSGSSSAVSSSSFSSSSSSSQPAGVGFPEMPPIGMPPLAMPPGATPADLLPVDPCLPCHSRHFVNRRAQMAAASVGSGAASAAASDQVTKIHK